MQKLDLFDIVDAREGSAPLPPWSARKTALAALLTAAAYYVGARLGLAFTFRPQPVSTMWPPNAILLAALLLAPARAWPIMLAAVFPAHMGVELLGGVPPTMAACWFVSNCTEALIGAVLVRRVLRRPVRLDTVHAVSVFVVVAAFFAPFASSFLDAAFVALNHWGESDYWSVWRMRFFANVLTTQTIVPIILGAGFIDVNAVRTAPTRRIVEAVLLSTSIIVVSLVVFVAPHGLLQTEPALQYAPFPLLLWAAVRFGSYAVSASLGGVAFASIWGAVHGYGPFTSQSPAENARSVQVFLVLISLPLAALAALIAERARAAESLRNIQRMAALSNGAARIGTWGMELDTDEILADDVMRSMFGISEEQARDRDEWMRRVHSADIERVLENQRAALSPDAPRDQRGDTAIPEIEYRIHHADGSIRWLLTRGTVLRRADGSPYRVAGAAIDITDRKRAEQERRENHERFELAATAANIGFWSFDFETMDVWTTDECRSIVGLSPEAVLSSLQWRELLHADDRPRAKAALEHAARTEAPLQIELRIVRPGGEMRHVTVSGRGERDAAGAPMRVIGVAIDVTDRRRVEREAGEQRRELVHLARVVTLGELSGALAHELGQPLAAIMANAQAASRYLERESVDREVVRTILQDIVSDDRRAGNVIRRLRQLLRKDTPPREPIDPMELVNDALSLARSDLIANNISFAVRCSSDLPVLFGDRVQLQQVLLNLILNARDAMLSTPPDTRSISIDLRWAPGERLRIAVVDSGTGVPADQLEQIFEPFFTTKPLGLGLGLAICRAIVVEHGGALVAENRDAGGTAFVIDLSMGVPSGPGIALSDRDVTPQAQITT